MALRTADVLYYEIPVVVTNVVKYNDQLMMVRVIRT